MTPPGLTTPRLLRAGGALALVVLLVATKWYGLDRHVSGDLGQGGASAVSGWDMLVDLRWLVLAVALVSLLSAAVPELSAPALVPLGGLAATLLTFLLFLRVLVWLPQPSSVVDIKPGAYLSLVAAGACALGAARRS